MQYFVLLIDAANGMLNDTIANVEIEYSYTANQDVKSGDMILGYVSQPINQTRMLLEASRDSKNAKLYLKKLLDVANGCHVEKTDGLQDIVDCMTSKQEDMMPISKELYEDIQKQLITLVSGIHHDKRETLIDHEYLYKLKNKEFAQEMIRILLEHDLLNGKNLQILTDKKLTSEILKNGFPILKKLDLSEEKSEQLLDDTKKSRYYSEETIIDGNNYVITNNWYYGGQSDRDTRTPFIMWTLKQINGEEIIGEDKVTALKDICVTAPEIVIPHNYLVFGAPGTGKSHEVKELQEKYFKEDEAYERVTFHSNYSYANFVGTYKPKMNGKDIEYAFVPGPFIRILEKAYKNPEKNFLLIIEEINRANPAAVFGDVFQLLDRKMGKSEYPVMTSEELKLYFAQKFVQNFNEISDEKKKQNILASYSEMYIPSNMYIWATMNSADQGVFPMDTAFKRRWDFKYITINENSKNMEHICVKVPTSEGGFVKINWNALRKEINERLSSVQCKVNEDKLLGPYFISGDKLKVNQEDNCVVDNDGFLKVFKNKVLMYLYEDAVKQRKTELFMGCGNVSRFSGICEAFDEKGIEIFGRDLAAKVIKITQEGSV